MRTVFYIGYTDQAGQLFSIVVCSDSDWSITSAHGNLLTLLRLVNILPIQEKEMKRELTLIVCTVFMVSTLIYAQDSERSSNDPRLPKGIRGLAESCWLPTD